MVGYKARMASKVESVEEEKVIMGDRIACFWRTAV